MKPKSLRGGLGALFILMWMPACFPVAWIVPPAKVDVGGGVTHRDVTRESQRYSGAIDLRGSVEPLAISPHTEDRLFDVSGGYGMRYGMRSKLVTHGPFLGATLMIPVRADGERRLTLGSQVHALVGRRSQGLAVVGQRVTGRIGFEWARWEDGPFDECDFGASGGFCGGGYRFGEVGWSPYTEVSRSWRANYTEWAWTFGVTLRIPASLGAGVVFTGFDWF